MAALLVEWLLEGSCFDPYRSPHPAPILQGQSVDCVRCLWSFLSLTLAQVRMPAPAAAAAAGSAEAFVLGTLHTSSQVATASVRDKLKGRRVPLKRQRPKPRSKGRSPAPPAAAGRVGSKYRSEQLRVEQCEITYQQALVQHDLWRAYAKDALAAVRRPQQVARVLLGIDRHGCRMQVLSCRTPSLVGADGVVISESARTLLLLGERRRVRVPKQGTVLRVCLPAGAGDSIPPSSDVDGAALLAR